jgi:small-conductance mechanosensitive channel
MSWLSDWVNYVVETISGLMTNLIIAVIIILIGFIVGRVLGKLTQKVLHELELDRILRETADIKLSIEKALARFITYFAYFLAIIIALNQIGLTTTVLHMISAAVLVIVVISIILGIKDFIPNFLAGMHINRKDMIKVGDRIRVKGTEGKVISMDLTETKIQTQKGDTIFIPNSLFIKEEMVKLGRKRRK